MQIPEFHNACVLTIGDAILDRYWHGATDRVSAEAPIPVVDVKETEERLGGAANVALNVAALGARASLVAVIGKDDSGVLLKAKLDTAGIRHRLCEVDDYPTITKLRILSRRQQLLRADFEKIVDIEVDRLMPYYEAALAESDAVILSDYDKGALADPAPLIAAARAAGKPVLVDPKFKDFSVYAGATVIKPNQQEFTRAVGGWNSESEFVSKCRALIERLGIEALLVTRHTQGMTLVRKDREELHLPARSREVYDVVGAGDTVVAVVASSLAAGATLEDAVGIATYAAGIVVARSGTASVSAPELKLEVANTMSYGNGVMSKEQLLIAVAEARQRKEKIVFTNGCFDILHAGHVDYLSEARECGDRLIVAVNDDASVHRLKGEGRPINAVDRRMTMLAGLSAVDWVVSFPEDTPETLLAELKPDVLVKGGDYNIDQVVGADIVRSYGGDVKVLKLVEGTSTSALVQKIREL
ncbi:MAG TPA: bifunctional D-glycero-beta-D-manno-heptose-7-phosphate kinase/D-glycero-beta-D-manno-heptose 1-phosphate adenylyltransferase HldE [Pseudomonadales bacterium]|nr:bifunctional D-glycero-beta-D-manno-heptose-7-phosphate kinase/D-glycero-beta-D-manno-heptose 1-phosphate adenylyltransferase HldE [Pseudomonadales bacterium]